MSTSAQKSLSTIDSFLGAVGQSVKAAAAPLSEAGSIGGETSHPVKSVDDRLQKAKEGERSAENAKDLKEDQGPPSVDSAGENKSAAEKSLDLIGRLAKRASEGSANPPGTAADDQLQIGTNKQPTGDDPANETNKAKAGKEDPGSSHPARTDNDSLDGHKYAYDANTPLEKMAADLQEVGNDLCARIEIYAQDLEKSASAPNTGATQPQVKQAAATNAGVLSPELAQQAGWEVAGILTGQMDKAASDQMVRNEVKGIIKEAFDDADRVAEFLFGRQRAMAKRANAGMPGGADDAAPPPDDEGAEAGGGAGPGPGMGGDPMGGMGGGDPSGGMGGAMGGGAGAGGPPGPEAIDAICQELQCTPEQLLDALMQTAGGGAGGAGGLGGAPGPGPEAGGAGGAMPPAPGGAGGPPPGMEVAAADKRAADKKAEVIGYIKEVIARSKR